MAPSLPLRLAALAQLRVRVREDAQRVNVAARPVLLLAKGVPGDLLDGRVGHVVPLAALGQQPERRERQRAL